MKDLAYEYAEIGYKVIHLAGKSPVEDNWTEKDPRTPEEIKKLFSGKRRYNMGIQTGQCSGIMCIDIDPRNDGHLWYEEHKHLLTEGVHELSGRGDGGRHIFYRMESPMKSGKYLGRGVDLLADGGHQVVVAPSIHPDTKKPYYNESEITLSDYDFIPSVPDFILEAEKVFIVKLEAMRKHANSVLKADIVDWDRVTIMNILSKLDPAMGRHHQIGYWIGNAVAAGMCREEITVLANQWLRDNGRKEGEQPNEVNNWIKDAEQNLANGVWDAHPAIAPELRLPDGLEEEDWEEVTDSYEPTKDLGKPLPWGHHLDKTDKGKLKATLKNVSLIMQNHERFKGCFGYNLFTNKSCFIKAPYWEPSRVVCKAGDPIHDNDLIAASFELGMNQKGVDFPVSKVYEGITHAAVQHAYHPVRDYLKSVKWDKTPRIKTWLADYLNCTAPKEYRETIGPLFLIAAVKRVMEPGCKFDSMMILEGLQGIGKSTICKYLAKEEYWFADQISSLGSTDAVDNIQGKWIVEMAELDTMNRSEASELKAFLSRTEDNARLAYRRETRSYPRQVVFIGSTNDHEYIQASAAGRRFWPVPMDMRKVKLNEFKEVVDQLWAEAYYEYLNDTYPNLYIDDPVASDQHRNLIKDRIFSDAWEDVISRYVESETDEEGKEVDRTTVTISDVCCYALFQDPNLMKRSDQMRISNILKQLGYDKKRAIYDGHRQLVYVKGEL